MPNQAFEIAEHLIAIIACAHWLTKVVISVITQCIAISFGVGLEIRQLLVSLLAQWINTAWRVGTVEKYVLWRHTWL